MSGRCPDPVGLERLSDYWLGELPEGEAREVEQHVFGCPSCAAEVQWLAGLAPSIRDLLKQGILRVGVSATFLARAVRDGIRIREYRVRPGDTVECTITPTDDLLVGRLLGDFAGVRRVDLGYRIDDGPELRVPDVPVSAGREVVLAERSDLLRSLTQAVVRLRLIGVDPEGDRVIGEYTFDHRSTP